MAGTSSDPVHNGMQLKSAIPVPTVVSQSMLPYAPLSCDLLTAVPAEVMERIAFNLDATSIRALRLTNKAAKEKSEFSFVKTCLHTLDIDSSKIGFRRGLKNVQAEWAGTALKQVIFTMPLQANGIRPGSKLIVPSRNDVKAVIDHIPNVTALVIRVPTGWSGLPNNLCVTLTASPSKYLSELTIDGCVLSVKVLTNFLNAHARLCATLFFAMFNARTPISSWICSSLLVGLRAHSFGLGLPCGAAVEVHRGPPEPAQGAEPLLHIGISQKQEDWRAAALCSYGRLRFYDWAPGCEGWHCKNSSFEALR